MTSSPRSPFAAGLAVASTLCLGSALLTSVPVFAQPADAPDCSAAGEDPAEPSESAAVELAAACGTEVLIGESVDYLRRSFAQPDGTVSSEFYLEPRFAPNADGEWVDIDTTLTEVGEGVVAPVASAAEVEFAVDPGTSPFATMSANGAQFTLAWPEPLEAGVVEGDSVTFAEVETGVDLVVRATKSGFTHVLVVDSPEAATAAAVAQPEFVFGGDAAIEVAEDGSVAVASPSGEVAAASEAIAWDSSAGESGSTGQSTPAAPGGGAAVDDVAVDVSGDRLRLEVDAEFLESAEYPVFIDPDYERKWATWAPVAEHDPNETWTSGSSYPREVVRVGQNYADTSETWRAHFRFGISSLEGRYIKGADVVAWANHTGWCNGSKAELWQTNTIASNTPSWNGMEDKWLHGGPLSTEHVEANSGSTCQDSNHWVYFNSSGVPRQVQRHADAAYPTITFGLRAESESNRNWMKFDVSSVQLRVNHATELATSLKTNGANCSTSGPGPWVADDTVQLTAKAPDFDCQRTVGMLSITDR